MSNLSQQSRSPPSISVRPLAYVSLRRPRVSHLKDSLAIEVVYTYESVCVTTSESTLRSMTTGSHDIAGSVPLLDLADKIIKSVPVSLDDMSRHVG